MFVSFQVLLVSNLDMKQRSKIDQLANIVALTLLPLTLAILVSWNTTPGDQLYGVRKSLTQATGQVLGIFTDQ